MGGLISRAYKRLTQGNQQRSRKDSQSVDQSADLARDAKRPARSLVQSIPVGQSIDSAEYRALEGNKNAAVVSRQAAADMDKENECSKLGGKKGDSEKKKDVEEAVIKIQALVRGHLARKALKDANQPANGLGQSQFDEESLTKNLGELRPQQQQPASIGRTNDNSRIPLESIAELVETTAASIGASVQQTAGELADLISKQAQAEKEEQKQEQEDTTERRNNNNRQKLASICQSRVEWQQQQRRQSLGGDDDGSSGRRDSAVSPVPSEANASIDLNTCDTPASASIDILDHDIRLIDRLATVLHPNQQQQQQAGTGHIIQVPIEVTMTTTTTSGSADNGDSTEQANREEIVCTPDSLDSEEAAAAIRIQSAFRGYRSRKNSPYRTRSPPNSIENNNSNSNNNNKRDAILRQQEAVVVNDEHEEELEAEQKARDDGHRESRSKQRDIVVDADLKSISGLEVGDVPSTEEDTTTVKEVLLQQNIDDSSIVDGTTAAAEPTEDDLRVEEEEEEDADENNNQGVSLSLGLSEVADALEETAIGLSAALESAPSQQSTDQCLVAPKRPSVAGESQKSQTSFDTDSSVLGAALSLNDEISTSGGGSDHKNQWPDKQAATFEESEAAAAAGASAEEADEDTIKLELEARRLVGELRDELDKDPGRSKDEETDLDVATNQLEAALEEAATTSSGLDDDHQEAATTLNADEQLAIELESDDIERRDPRGQASIERTRSPQISTEMEPIELVLLADERGGEEERPQDDDDDDVEAVQASKIGGQLMAKKPDQEASSGRSSPAVDSSNGGSNSDLNSDHGDDYHEQQQQQQQSSQATTHLGPNKSKKRNRNKKRGKK